MCGVKILKKILSLLISVVLFITSLSAGLVVVAETIPHESDLDVFANNLSEMLREYDVAVPEEQDEIDILDEITDRFPIVYSEHSYSSFLPETDDNMQDESTNQHMSAEDFGLSADAFELKRLIVKSAYDIDYCGAVDCISGYRDLFILQYDSVEKTAKAYDYYLSSGLVEYVEPDLIHKTQEEQFGEIIDADDISFEQSGIGFENIKEKMSEYVLEDIVVAVLDSGIDTDHEVFEGRLLDNNYNCSSSGENNSCEDDFGHGTHVAGIIVNNTLNNVKIKPYKVLNYEGKGSLSAIIVAVDLAVQEGADIINMSLTAEGESQAMTEAIDRAVEKGLDVVVAAGNKGDDLNKVKYTPACVESAVTVSAVNPNYKLSSYSNYNGTIDIAAPGDNVESAYLNNTYVKMSGTSMAAPQVAAGIAFVRSFYIDKTNLEAEALIKEYATKIADDSNNNKYGSGVLYMKYIFDPEPRTIDPVFSIDSCSFVNSFNVSIKCFEENSRIYYLKKEGDLQDSIENDVGVLDLLDADLYQSQIKISVDTTLIAIAMTDDKEPSSIVYVEYDRLTENEEDFYDINTSGHITGYFGSDNDLIIPQKVHGQMVIGIAASAFKGNTDIHSVILPATVNVIGASAFEDCTNLESVTGGTVINVGSKAFANSSIREFNFEKTKILSDKAFYNCTNLTVDELTSLEKIGVSAFENAGIIQSLDSSNIKSIGKNAFKGSQIISVNLPNVETVDSSAFENCTSLTTASMPKLAEVSSNLFKNCSSLSVVDMESITSISSYAFSGTAIIRAYFPNAISIGNYAFKDIETLKFAMMPVVESASAGCFMGCTSLKCVCLASLKELKTNTFSGCDSLKSLWLPSVEKVNSNSFNNSAIEYLQFDSVKTIGHLPSNLKGIILPSTLETVSAKVPSTDFVVYGYEETIANQFAIDNSKKFVNVPVLVFDMPESVNTEEKYLIAYSLGFNCTYQWYKNDIQSNENGIAIENATNFWYEPKREDNAACYYCVITSDDGINETVVTTHPVTNALEYQEADYSAYYSLLDEMNDVDREIYTEESLFVLDELLNTDISGFSLAEQYLIDEHIEKIKDAFLSLAYKYILGDVNADGKMSLLDARFVLKVVSGTEELDRIQTLSADMNEDGEISLIDVRLILRMLSETVE